MSPSSLPWACFLALACCAGCRPPSLARATPEEDAGPRRTWTRTVRRADVALPRWDEAANLRVSTVGLDPAEVLALRPGSKPTFVRVTEAGISVTPCESTEPARLQFEPEFPQRQRWVWNDVELKANVRTGQRLEGASEAEIELTPSGSYWLDRARIGELRRQDCRDATHVVAVFRVGRLGWLDDSNESCAVGPSSTDAPPGCDLPWLLELVALDPHAPRGVVCPDSTVWTGFYCRAADRLVQVSEPPCNIDRDALVCDEHWPRDPGWGADPIGLPLVLEDDEVADGLAPALPELRACAPDGSTIDLAIVIEGMYGRIVELELPKFIAVQQADCLVEVASTVRFPTFVRERQTIPWRL